jgi:hypothetical protein
MATKSDEEAGRLLRRRKAWGAAKNGMLDACGICTVESAMDVRKDWGYGEARSALVRNALCEKMDVTAAPLVQVEQGQVQVARALQVACQVPGRCDRGIDVVQKQAASSQLDR